MTTKTDGGSAFPVWELNGNDQPEMTEFGMSLRDYFAARIAPEILRQFSGDGTMVEHSEWRQGVAVEAYRIADEMLEMRRRS